MEIYGINGKPVEVDPAVFAALHPGDQAMLQQPPATPLSIHVMYGPTFEIDENNDTHDDEYGTVRLVGFQDDENVQRVSLFVDDWRKDPKSALGKYPVFSRGSKGIYFLPIRVTIVRADGERYR
jgi:hypothetical protein